jgi:very-short-patch-repair endonuclease
VSTLKARTLRRQATDAEQKLWQYLRSRQLRGYKFRRQQPIGRYIVDFVCFEGKLVIELDGGQHAEKTKADQKRTTWLGSQGFHVQRFWDNDVLQNLEGVAAVIGEVVGGQRDTPHLNPLPQGERRPPTPT